MLTFLFYVKLTNYKIKVTTQAKQIVSISLFHHHLDIRCTYNIHNRVQVTASHVLSFLILIPGHSPGCADMGAAPCNVSAQEGKPWLRAILLKGYSNRRSCSAWLFAKRRAISCSVLSWKNSWGVLDLACGLLIDSLCFFRALINLQLPESKHLPLYFISPSCYDYQE